MFEAISERLGRLAKGDNIDSHELFTMEEKEDFVTEYMNLDTLFNTMLGFRVAHDPLSKRITSVEVLLPWRSLVLTEDMAKDFDGKFQRMTRDVNANV